MESPRHIIRLLPSCKHRPVVSRVEAGDGLWKLFDLAKLHPLRGLALRHFQERGQ